MVFSSRAITPVLLKRWVPIYKGDKLSDGELFITLSRRLQYRSKTARRSHTYFSTPLLTYDIYRSIPSVIPMICGHHKNQAHVVL